MALDLDYLNIDFNTLVQKFSSELKASDSFADTNYEGANITAIIELFSYIGELSAFYSNQIAKNLYEDTVDVYENAHRISTMKGYDPKGYTSAEAVVSFTISQSANNVLFTYGDQIIVPAWTTVTTKDGSITYTVPSTHSGTIPASGSIPTSAGTILAYGFDVPVKQGIPTTLTYKGSDIVDGQIVLPFQQFDHDINVDDTMPCVEVSVDGEDWAFVKDFFDDISGLSDETDKVFKFIYNKYQQYCIEFSSTRSVPASTAAITVTLLKTLGPDGAVGAGSLIVPKLGNVYNATKAVNIPVANITVTNALASTGGQVPETIDQIKNASKGIINSQKRNVTKSDYISHLLDRTDIVAANAWGEQDIYPEGSTAEYNKVHITVVPKSWTSSTVATSGYSWTPFAGTTGTINLPVSYSSTFASELLTYLEPRKMISTYEVFELPTLVFFAFDIGVKVKRLYNFLDVAAAVRNKLAYYFSPEFRSFGETISFMDIQNFILDTSVVSSSDSFTAVKGIDTLVFREIVANTTIYAKNTIGNYPQYTRDEFTATVDNKLKVIQLRYDQFAATLDAVNVIEQEL